ncbi:MFS transporter [Streptomyces sp. NPDC047453]|uniref:MFS transporter n=1 Tax=Streptomyces sp. NPDC047453 TaxID=3154812 RepID=UPI0033C5287E
MSGARAGEGSPTHAPTGKLRPGGTFSQSFDLAPRRGTGSTGCSPSQVIGPGLGGAMIAAIGAPAALWVSTAWYGLSLLMLLPLRGYGKVVHDQAQSVRAMVVGGLRIISRSRLAVAVLVVTLAANTLLWPVYQAFMPVFAEESLGLDAAGLGALLTCSGIGGLAGSLVIAGMGDFPYKGGVFVFGTTVWAALWAVFALSRTVSLSFVVMCFIGLTSAAFGVLQTTLLPLTTDPAVHGRALGLQELCIGVMPVATLVLGATAERAGVARTVFCAALLLVCGLGVLALRVPALLTFSGRRTP